MPWDTYTPEKGEKVLAFHPRMFGVVKTGTVVQVTATSVRIDFGPLLGGTFNVRRSHVVDAA